MLVVGRNDATTQRRKGQETESAAAQLTLRLAAPNARPVDYIAVPRPKPDAAALAGYAGDYQSPELEVTYHLVARRDTLQIARAWQPPIPLRPLYRDGFSAGDEGLIRFLRDGRGRVTGFVLWAGRVRHLRFERVGKP